MKNPFRSFTISKAIPWMLLIGITGMVGMLATVRWNQAVEMASAMDIVAPMVTAAFAALGFDFLYFTFSLAMVRDTIVRNKWALGFGVFCILVMAYANIQITEYNIPPQERLERYILWGVIAMGLATGRYFFTMSGSGRRFDDGVFDNHNADAKGFSFNKWGNTTN